MSDDQKRWILFFILAVTIPLGVQSALNYLGLIPKPPVTDQAIVEPSEVENPNAGPALAFADDPKSPPAFADNPAPPASLTADTDTSRPARPAVLLVAPETLILGDKGKPVDPKTGYRLEAELTQTGAGLRKVMLNQHQTELLSREDRGNPLTLLNADPDRFSDAFGPPLAVQVLAPRKDDLPGNVPMLPANVPLFGDEVWEVVPDEQGRLVRLLPAQLETGRLEGMSIVFRISEPKFGLTVTKTIGLRKGADGLEVKLEFSSDRPQTLVYRLLGPYGMPIEGEWYTSTFREMFFGKTNGLNTELETKTAGDVKDKEEAGDPIRTTTYPIKYAGIENQYFASFLEPDPLPITPDQRHDDRTIATVIKPALEKLKSEISVVLESRPMELAPGSPVTQSYRVFAGPKTIDSLAPYGAEDLTAYRKGWQIPLIGTLATYLARNVIAPLLDQIYGFTRQIAGLWGGKNGSYGLAIILLTIVVRLCIFPLSRKQAQSAKKMQDLQPQMVALREKYKEDKEKIGRETLLLYKKNGVNPMGGCLLPLIQMPIFLGLWQALNNSVSLRNAPFLWISNLAAPDMLAKFPSEMPFLGPYFNLLPFLVVALMLVQTKLFSPPATSPEQKQQQQIMYYMLVFMAVMFYRVPSGLGLYFITSSLWSICERLLLPKGTPAALQSAGVDASSTNATPALKSGSRGNTPNPAKTGEGSWRDRLKERLDQVMEDAAHDKTVRNTDKDRPADKKRPPRPGSGGNPPTKRNS